MILSGAMCTYSCRPLFGAHAAMSDIEIDPGLTGYLEKDATVIEVSRKEWEPEYTALSRLVDIFRRISQLVVIKDNNLSLPSQLFLVVLNQSYGVASELLRRRTRDAQALMRRAVEAARVAHRLWKHPELIQVFNECYPDINDDKHLHSLGHRRSTVRNLAPRSCFPATVQPSKHWEACTNCSALVHYMRA